MSLLSCIYWGLGDAVPKVLLLASVRSLSFAVTCGMNCPSMPSSQPNQCNIHISVYLLSELCVEGSDVIRESGVTCSVGDAKAFPVCQAGTRLCIPQLVLSLLTPSYRGISKSEALYSKSPSGLCQSYLHSSSAFWCLQVRKAQCRGRSTHFRVPQ